MRQPKSLIAFEHLPDSAYIRLRQLVGTVLPFSSATLWRKCRRGEFPPPVRLSAGITAWRVGQIRLWLEDPTRFQTPQHAPKAGRRL
jgi:prophage regulatory protein